MDGPSLERLHDMVPAALEEDLLAEVRAEAQRQEVRDLMPTWHPDHDPEATALPGSPPLPHADDEPLPEEQEPPPPTPGQVLGLVEHQLGAVPLHTPGPASRAAVPGTPGHDNAPGA